MLNVDEIETENKNKRGEFVRKVYDSRRWRIQGGSWHPTMLADYAHDAGIDLVGFRSLKQQFDDRRALD